MRAILATLALAASNAHAVCAWSDPGANRFTGDPVAAVMSYGDIPPQARAELAEAVKVRAYSAFVDIRRDSIAGGRYTHMRAMHWGAGQQCMGDVDRSAWPADRVERGLVYCVRGHCVIVPTVCGNVARVNAAGVTPQPDPAPRALSAALTNQPRAVPEPSALLLALTALTALAFLRARG